MKPAEYAKAIAGGVIAGLGVLYIALSDDRVTAQEGVAVAIASLTSFATVWGIPNAPKTDLVTQHVMTVTSTEVSPSHVDEPADVVYKPVEELAGPPTYVGAQDDSEAPKHSADHA